MSVIALAVRIAKLSKFYSGTKMTVRAICVCDAYPAHIGENDAFLLVTNEDEGVKKVLSEQMNSGGLFDLKLMVNSYSDVQAVLSDWLSFLGSKQEMINVVVYSDCKTIDASDVALIGHIMFPAVPVRYANSKQHCSILPQEVVLNNSTNFEELHVY